MQIYDSTMLHIGTTPQYFFDNLVIEQCQDITRRFHRPSKEPGPVLQKDKPWEIIPYLTVNGWSIIKEDDGLLRCFYDDWPCDTDEVVRQKTIYFCRGFTSLATSQDGVHWDKSPLGLIRRDGVDTNIVLGMPLYSKLDSTHVFKDTLDPDPDRRYKLFCTHYITDTPDRVSELTLQEKMNATVRQHTGERIEIDILCSADGLTWKPLGELPRFGRDGNRLGDASNIFIDMDACEYRLLTRAMGMVGVEPDRRRPLTDSFLAPVYPHDVGRVNKRRIFQAVSADIVHWSHPRLIFGPDPESDNLDDSFYGATQIKIGDVYVGFVNVFHEVDNTVDVMLTYSRDGWNWTPVDNRRPWLTTGAAGWDRTMVNVGSPPIAIGDELFVFYGGAANHHDWWITGKLERLDPAVVPEAYDPKLVNYGLGLAKLRKDGFVSVDAGPAREGVLITRGLWVEGNTLIINADCRENGSIACEITDSQETVLGRCSRQACDVFRGSSTAHRITWNGSPEIPVRGQLRVRFFLRNASLYSFGFSESE